MTPLGDVTDDDALIVNVAALTATERRVLAAMAMGLSREQSAESLRLSVHTVGHALTSAKERIGARTLAHAAALLRLASAAPQGEVGFNRK